VKTMVDGVEDEIASQVDATGTLTGKNVSLEAVRSLTTLIGSCHGPSWRLNSDCPRVVLDVPAGGCSRPDPLSRRTPLKAHTVPAPEAPIGQAASLPSGAVHAASERYGIVRSYSDR